jgi:5-carboxymethyl-2-hydroxymuconate isomerase
MSTMSDPLLRRGYLKDIDMPHIVFECTPQLATDLDFDTLMSSVHQELAQSGHARLEDLKSRVHVTDTYLAAQEPRAQFVVARLITTNPRPHQIRQEMAQIIHDYLRCAIEQEPRSYWWQCCVLIEAFDRSDYLKTDSHELSRTRTSAVRYRNCQS